MPSFKYNDFKESPPFTIRAKHNKNREDVFETYVTLTCPHCHQKVADVVERSLHKQKSTKCKAHLETCAAFAQKGQSVQPAPVRASTSDMQRQLAEMRVFMQQAEARRAEAEERARQERQEMIARISRNIGLGDPDAVSESDLVVRAKKKRRRPDNLGSISGNDIRVLSNNKFFKRVIESLKHDEKCTTDEERKAIERIRESINEANKRM